MSEYTLCFYGSKPKCNCGGIRRAAILFQTSSMDLNKLQLEKEDIVDNKKKYKEIAIVGFNDVDNIISSLFSRNPSNLSVQLTGNDFSFLENGEKIFNVQLENGLSMLSTSYPMKLV